MMRYVPRDFGTKKPRTRRGFFSVFCKMLLVRSHSDHLFSHRLAVGLHPF